MEHDIEKIIQEKVKIAEQKPVKWEKDGAWDKISTELRPKKKTRIFYYAAASLILATTLLIYSLQFVKQKGINQKLKSLELAVANKVDERVDDQQTFSQDCPEERHVVEQQKRTKPYNKNRKVKEANPVVNSVTEVEVREKLPLPQTQSEQETEQGSLSPYKPIATKSHRVEPIIGVIIPQREAVTVVKEKKVKFHLFKSSEEGIDKKEDDIKIIFARIN